MTSVAKFVLKVCEWSTCTIRLEKVFDSLHRQTLWIILEVEVYGLPPNFMYSGNRIKVKRLLKVNAFFKRKVYLLRLVDLLKVFEHLRDFSTFFEIYRYFDVSWFVDISTSRDLLRFRYLEIPFYRVLSVFFKLFEMFCLFESSLDFDFSSFLKIFLRVSKFRKRVIK